MIDTTKIAAEWKPVNNPPEVKLGEVWSGLATDGRIVFTAKFQITYYNSLTGEHTYGWSSPEFAGDITKYITDWREMPAPPPKKR
jgi:hypothetical protein